MHVRILLAVLTALARLSSADDAVQDAQTVQRIRARQGAQLENITCGVNFSNRTCPNGLCCSQAGYCGSTSEYCSVPDNCQQEFGWCDSETDPTGANVTFGSRKYNENIPAVIEQCTQPRTLALTFDDGPSNYTDELLGILKAYNARATFFLGGILNGRGPIDDAWAPTLRRMIMDGHQIASHTWSHPNLNNLTSAQRKMQMHKNERAIANVIGKIPTFMRPPRVICDEACQQDMKDLGYHIVNWQYDSQDSKVPRPSIAEMVANLNETMYNMPADGNMLTIQHDINAQATPVTAGLLQNLRQGWQAVPVVECLGYSLDEAFQYPAYSEYKGPVSDGCLVSGPNFCIQPQPFSNKTGCNQALTAFRTALAQCRALNQTNLTLPAREHCRETGRLVDDMEHFCDDCGETGMVDCDWMKFGMVRT